MIGTDITSYIIKEELFEIIHKDTFTLHFLKSIEVGIYMLN